MNLETAIITHRMMPGTEIVNTSGLHDAKAYHASWRIEGDIIRFYQHGKQVASKAYHGARWNFIPDAFEHDGWEVREVL